MTVPLAVILTFGLAGSALALTDATTTSIAGTVKDDTRRMLRGVTIAVNSL